MFTLLAENEEMLMTLLMVSGKNKKPSGQKISSEKNGYTTRKLYRREAFSEYDVRLARGVACGGGKQRAASFGLDERDSRAGRGRTRFGCALFRFIFLHLEK